MKERRDYERIKLYHYLKVYDVVSGESIGSMVDISESGCKIISDISFTVGEKESFKMELPKGYINNDEFIFEAECRWSDYDEDNNCYIAGFKFTKIEKESFPSVMALINDFKIKGLI